MDRLRVRAPLLGLVLLLSAAAVAANVVPAKVPKEEVACVENLGGESVCGAVADLAITLDDVDANTRGGVYPGRGERGAPGTHQCVYNEDMSTIICGKLLRDDVLYGNSHPLSPPLPPVTPPPVYPPVPPVTPPPVYPPVPPVTPPPVYPPVTPVTPPPVYPPVPPVTPPPVYPPVPPVTPLPVYPPVPLPHPPKEQPPHGYRPALPSTYTPPLPLPPPPPPLPPTVPPRVAYKVPLTPSAKGTPTESTYNNPHVVPYPPPAPTVKPPFLPQQNYPALGVPIEICTQHLVYGRQAPQTDQPAENGNYPSAKKEETDSTPFSQRAAEQSRGTGLGSSLPRQTIITCDAATIVRPGISNPVNLIADSLNPLHPRTEYPAPPNPTYRNNGHENSPNFMNTLTSHASNREIIVKTNTPEDIELEKLGQEMLNLQNTEKETNEKFRREKEALEKRMNNIRGNSMTQPRYGGYDGYGGYGGYDGYGGHGGIGGYPVELWQTTSGSSIYPGHMHPPYTGGGGLYRQNTNAVDEGESETLQTKNTKMTTPAPPMKDFSESEDFHESSEAVKKKAKTRNTKDELGTENVPSEDTEGYHSEDDGNFKSEGEKQRKKEEDDISGPKKPKTKDDKKKKKSSAKSLDTQKEEENLSSS